MSRVGKKAITFPQASRSRFSDRELEVKGAKGTLKTPVPEGITFKQEDDQLVAERARMIWPRSTVWRARWQTTRSSA